MNVLFTGASSPLGAAVASRLLRSEQSTEIWCTVHRRAVPLESPKLRQQAVDLSGDFTLDPGVRTIDLLVHFASLTHAADSGDYRRVNVDGSLRLVEQSRGRGCRRMFFVSTRCVGPDRPAHSCGAYAESKRSLEAALRRMEWDSLVIVRPAEVYGAGGTEGIDQFIRLARTWRVVPLLFGEPRIRFAPLHCNDFARAASRLLDEMPSGVHIYEMCGPQSLDGPALAQALAKRFGAVPVPVWFPLLAAALKGLGAAGWSVIAPDQIDRLIGDKSSDATTAAWPWPEPRALISDTLEGPE